MHLFWVSDVCSKKFPKNIHTSTEFTLILCTMSSLQQLHKIPRLARPLTAPGSLQSLHNARGGGVVHNHTHSLVNKIYDSS